MFDSYQEIFSSRGNAYHQAMVELPDARRPEFEAILSLADIQEGSLVCDAPSGGGYLAEHIKTSNVHVISVDSASQFVSQYNHREGITGVCCDMSNAPFGAGVFDSVLSLAGLHHLVDRGAFYNEAYRSLKPGGDFTVADVAADTGVADFLNTFVNKHNSMGHKGIFFRVNEAELISQAGFAIDYQQTRKYQWIFPTKGAMARYCKLLFGIDKADECEILSGIKRHLGYELSEGWYLMNWELMFIHGRKVSL